MFRIPLVPDPARFPKRLVDWLPLVLVVTLVSGIATTGILYGPWLLRRLNCHEGWWLDRGIWQQDGECVGIAKGAYAFGQQRFESGIRVIDSENYMVDR